MADDICVCGHTKSKHTGMSGKDRYCKYGSEGNPPEGEDASRIAGCLCENFRPVLPWPDSEGWWWCDKLGLVEVQRQPGGLWLEGYGEGGFESDCTFAPARFTKLLEHNPLVAEQED